MGNLKEEINRRRTFAIISHPDAGKTTLTEKFLLYGGAINLAGSVKGKATARHAVSDWMEIEKQRGISVTSSVLQFEYDGFCINILDTPGHQDFSEDTYRTLMAADSAVMVIDASKGVEAQTRKLFKVCVMRKIPIFTFINKMDRDANDTFDLLDDIEKELGIATCPMNWPIGSGKSFKGVYDREKRCVITYASTEEQVIEKETPSVTNSQTSENDVGGTSRVISESSRQENTVYQTGRDGSKTPYVTHTLSAKVEGVTVLAQGGDSPVLKKNITEAIEALFDIEPHKIKVAKMADTR